jgi:hypothetical protein
MPDPINRTILLLDIEGFGKHDDVQQTFMRRVLYDVVRATLEAAGVEPTAQRLEDRGDSVIALVNPEIPKVRLLRALLTETPALLHGYNRVAASSTQVRLRIVLASGEVALHEIPGALGGLVGSDLNQACRVLDSQLLRDALRTRPGESVLCVSESVYRGTVSHGYPGIRPEEFHRIVVPGKEGPVPAWLHGTDAPATPPPDDGEGRGDRGDREPTVGRDGAEQHDRAPGGTVIFLDGAQRFGGSLVGGSQTVNSGGRVGGDVFGGSKHVWTGPEQAHESEDSDETR